MRRKIEKKRKMLCESDVEEAKQGVEELVDC